ncbi:ribonuclease D [Bathymodiolus septemdierum thioautotrophic gill symbiont]|uniref:Ribonuclease D n=1 Tax=endosymbiont of Bathymodiolus septemdierum str. Myojin knoll TaxID=1303921 RepID=A0A0P0US91_9GAMM|nr:ribonuclease D [Bathymodiolus septemdierum thioautotrophic gill symbiont]BAS68030.1 ribonuclease D [endosymbiont of Bathymodiolus septemdierum str. Myojin knoll]
MIKNNTELTDFLHCIKSDTELAIDTEFKWVDSYYPQLCLLQIATNTIAACIDVLAIEDLQPLFNKIYQPDVLWIAHAARNDIEVLYRYSRQLPAQVFDTQIAVSLLKNLRPTNSDFGAQISYQWLTEILQGVTLDKAFTRLDWTMRPLPDEAIKYALEDVTYSIKNYHQLKKRLENEGKLDWLLEEGQSILDAHIHKPNIFQCWDRVKGFSRIPKKRHTFAVQLAGWREQMAIDKNKPRRWIMTDNDLIDIAMDKQQLTDEKQKQFSLFLAKNPYTIELDTHKQIPPTAKEKAQKLILQTHIEDKASQNNLTAEVITSGKNLLRYLRGDQSVNFLSGWRYDLLKEELEKCKIV